MSPRTAPEEWLSTAEAAALLGVKERQLQERAKTGYIEKRHLPRQLHERTAPVRFSRSDIEAILAGKPNMHARIVDDIPSPTPPAPAETAPQTALAVAPEHSDSQLVAALKTALFERPALAASSLPTPFVTLEEGAIYSGLPTRLLKRYIRNGTLPAARFGGKWYIKRCNLRDMEFAPSDGLTQAARG
jgi:hypothetical protein